MSESATHVATALGIVFAAGAATGIGGAVVFFPIIIKVTSTRVLAAGLSLSAGVMMYIALTEIPHKSSDRFVEAGFSEVDAYMYSTACFFGGMILMMVIGIFCEHRHSMRKVNRLSIQRRNTAALFLRPHNVTGSDDPLAEFNHWRKVLSENERMPAIEEEDEGSTDSIGNESSVELENGEGKSMEKALGELGALPDTTSDNDSGSSDERSFHSAEEHEEAAGSVDPSQAEEGQRLNMTALQTAISIALHNFPEGLVGFLTTLADPKVGAMLAIAIALHNIPEGICVSMPMFYATGSRWKGFLWALLSGMTEPLAGLLAWAVLSNGDPLLLAIFFGISAGMMVLICVKELIPTARKVDPKGTIVTISFSCGMAFMSLSMVLLAFFE